MSKHDPHCGLCGLRVYGLWVADEPPPLGCSNGLDDAPWTCGHVLNSLQMATVSIDWMGGQLKPHHERIIQIIGQERADQIMDHCRQHRRPPPAGKMREPNYDSVAN